MFRIINSYPFHAGIKNIVGGLHPFTSSGIHRFFSEKHPLLSEFKELTFKKNFLNGADTIKRVPPSEEKIRAIVSAFPFYIQQAQKEAAREPKMGKWHYRHVEELMKSLPGCPEKTALIKTYGSLISTEGDIHDFGEEELTEGYLFLQRLVLAKIGRKKIQDCIQYIEIGSANEEEENKLFAFLIEKIVETGVAANPLRDANYLSLSVEELEKQPVLYSHISNILDRIPSEPRREKLLDHALECLTKKREIDYASSLKHRYAIKPSYQKSVETEIDESTFFRK